jgi:hypothetical protein
VRGQSGNRCRSAKFPMISETLRDRFSVGEILLRSFGIFAEDREIDFDLTPRPMLETQIVRCCTQSKEMTPPKEDFFWELDVSTRIQCLLIIAALGEEAEQLIVDVQCQNQDCRQEMELEFSIEELARMQPKEDRSGLIRVRVGEDELVFRRPTGRDQLDWLSRSYANTKAAVKSMAKTLIVGDRSEALRVWEMECLDDASMRAIGVALTAADPLVNFIVRTRCPDCGRDNTHSLDLGLLALGKLRGKQDRLLETIHALASRYHWTEDQILAIPLWRRSRFLAMIEKEKA